MLCLLHTSYLQLFNQMNARKIIDSSLAWEGLSNAKWFQVIRLYCWSSTC